MGLASVCPWVKKETFMLVAETQITNMKGNFEKKNIDETRSAPGLNNF